eukprot:scaffold1501_cov293-Chaetoceros_neogracile.AAC.2
MGHTRRYQRGRDFYSRGNEGDRHRTSHASSSRRGSPARKGDRRGDQNASYYGGGDQAHGRRTGHHNSYEPGGNEGDRHRRTSHASNSRRGSPARKGDRRGDQNASYYGGGDQAHGRRAGYHNSYEPGSNWRDSNEYEYDRSRRDHSYSSSNSYFQNRQRNSSANRTDVNKEVKGEGECNDTFRDSAVKVDHTQIKMQIQNNDASPPVPRKIAAKTEDGKRKIENSSTHAAAEPNEIAVNPENNARPPHKKPKSEFDSIMINKANWNLASLDEKLMSQYPHDIVDLRIRHLIKEDPFDWMQKKITASKQALDKINAEIEVLDSNRNEAYSDSEDSFQPAYHEPAKASGTASPAGLEDFVSSLPYCILLDQGFLMWGIHPDDEKYCFCPCSKMMQKWRNNFDLCLQKKTIDNCDSFRQNTPNAFMDHLKKKKIGENESAFLHKAVYYYLLNLYKNYWDHVHRGVHHKGLYAVGTLIPFTIPTSRYVTSKRNKQQNNARNGANECILV